MKFDDKARSQFGGGILYERLPVASHGAYSPLVAGDLLNAEQEKSI